MSGKLPAWANPPAGTEIRNTGVGAYEDPDNLGTVIEVNSNEVVVRIAEVAGITVTSSTSVAEAPSTVAGAGSNQDDGSIDPGDIVYFTFNLTNVGNDSTQFFIADAPSAITGGTLAGDIQIISYDPDGTGSSTEDLTADNITVPAGGATTGTLLNGIPAAYDGAILRNGAIAIRVPIKIDANLNDGDTVTVVMGDTPVPPNASTQNESYTAGNKDIYTQDNPDGTIDEAAGAPINGEREASGSQDVTVAIASAADYGDAPAAYGDASHKILSSPTLYLGSIAPDDEADTQLGDDAGISAAGDDNDGNDDEDAFVALPDVNIADGAVTSNYSIDVPLINNSGNPATLHAWIDFNQNNQFEASEYQSAAVNNNDTSANLNWTVPVGTLLDRTNARFRLTSVTLSDNPATNNLDERSIGSAADGEVEDYQVAIAEPTIANPSAPANNGFCYYSDRFEWSDYASGGLPVSIGGITIDGSVVETSFASADTPRGNGISTGTQGAEAGNYFLTMGGNPDINPTTPGDYFVFQYTFDPGITDLSFRLIDVDKGGWTDIATVTASYQGNSVPVTLTAEGSSVSVSGNRAEGLNSANPQQTLANVRVDIAGPVDTVDIRYEAGTYSAQVIWIGDFGLCNSDYGDNPASYGEAIHTGTASPDLYLGSVEPDDDRAASPLASAAAEGDDTTDTDDEDAFTALDRLSTTDTYNLTIPLVNTTGGSAIVYGWIDFDKNGKFDRSEHQQVTVADGETSADLSWAVADGVTSGSTFARFRITADNLIDDTNTEVDERSIGISNRGEVEDYSVEFALDPNLLLVKRITAINNVSFDNFVDDGTADNADNHPNWPDSDSDSNNNINTYLRGAIDRASIKPGDEVEYTIYFLSNGSRNADSVQICDVIPDNMSFIPDSFSRYSGIALQNSSASGATAVNLSNIVDSDAGRFYAPGTALPKVTVGDPPQVKNLCQKVVEVNGTATTVEVDASNNDNGALVVEFDSLPAASSSGTPSNSYGFIRFRTKIQ